ncbi:MAG TPA: lipopolysaccharide biosynthesis protein [Thermoplasmata archaeon]|nr:lipopolysaccharide biosynthesis protein [Thermoplasmata archaeon]
MHVGNNRGGIQRPIGRIWGEVKSPLYRNALFLMINSAAGSALGFVFWVIMYRVYDLNDIGFAVALFSTVSFVSSLALLGYNVSLVRYLPEAEDQVGLINASLTLVGSFAILLGFAYILVIAVFNLGLAFVLANPVYIAGIVLGAVGVGMGTVYDAVVLALRRADLGLWRGVSMALLKIPIALGIAYTLSQPFGVGRLGVFLALVLATGASVLIEGLWLLPRVLPAYRVRPRFHFSPLRRMFHFSAGNYAAAVVGAAGATLLTPMILVIKGAGAVSYFYAASAVAGLLSVIPGAAFSSFFAEASQKASNKVDRHRDERRALLLAIVLLAPAIVAMLVFAPFLLFLFGGSSDYSVHATAVLQILVFAAIPGLLGNVLVTRVRIRRRSLPLIVGSSIATVVNLGLGYAWLQSSGINGLASATVLGSIAPLPYYWYVARMSFQQEPKEPLDTTPIQP